MATDDLGIRQIPPMAGETADDAIARTILQILRELTAGTRNVVPMGAVSVALRRDVDWDISKSAIGATVERIDDLRGSTAATPPQPAVVLPGAPPVLDSVQR